MTGSARPRSSSPCSIAFVEGQVVNPGCVPWAAVTGGGVSDRLEAPIFSAVQSSTSVLPGLVLNDWADADAMRAAVAAHDTLLCTAIETRGGWSFEQTGDGVCSRVRVTEFGGPRCSQDIAKSFDVFQVRATRKTSS